MNNKAFTDLLKRAGRMHIRNRMGDSVTLGYAIQHPEQVSFSDQTEGVLNTLEKIWLEIDIRSSEGEPFTATQERLLGRN